MTKKIAITTSSFGQGDPCPLEILERNQLSVILNQQRRTLKREEILNLLEGCLGVIAGTEIYDRDVLERLKGLRVISRCGTGMDNLDLNACKIYGIKVFNTPDAATRAVAELVIGLVFNLLREINAMDHKIHTGTWEKRMGRLFLDKKIGIIGFGRIGKEVARLASALGAKIFYYDPVECYADLAYATRNELEELLSHCDIISLHVPYTVQTKNFIGQKEFSLMKQGALLINCSRGGIVDEATLYAALKSGKLAGAGIDVFNHEPYQGPLCELENVILTPHIGSYAKEARLRMELTAVDNLLRGLRDLS